MVINLQGHGHQIANELLNLKQSNRSDQQKWVKLINYRTTFPKCIFVMTYS